MRLNWGLATVIAVFLGIQLVPYGHDRVNPPVRQEPAWDSARTRELAVRACFNCHSNETVWPWYAALAPASWFVQRDVDEGRREVNFSEWDRYQPKRAQLVNDVVDGDMPPFYYPWGRLTEVERRELARGLAATAGLRDPRPGAGCAEDHPARP